MKLKKKKRKKKIKNKTKRSAKRGWRRPSKGSKRTGPATAKGHTVNATTEVHRYVQEGASDLKSLLPGRPPRHNTHDAFQATTGNSVNSFILFFFFFYSFFVQYFLRKGDYTDDQCI